MARNEVSSTTYPTRPPRTVFFLSDFQFVRFHQIFTDSQPRAPQPPSLAGCSHNIVIPFSGTERRNRAHPRTTMLTAITQRGFIARNVGSQGGMGRAVFDWAESRG